MSVEKAETAYSGPREANGKGTVYYFYPDGDVEIRIGGTAAWRNNNPGNLKEFPQARPDHNYTRNHGSIGRNRDNGFAIFPDWETGLKAKKDLLLTSNYDNMTLYDAIEKYAPEKDGNDPLDYSTKIAERATGTGEGKVTIHTPFRDITGSSARRKAMYDYIDIREATKPGAVIRMDKDDFLFSAPEGWSPQERVAEDTDPETPSQGWGDVFSRDDADYEIAENLAQSLIPTASGHLALWNPGAGFDEVGALAWRNSANRIRLAGRIKESIDGSQDNIVSTGREDGLVYLAFESGRRVSFDQMGNKRESVGDGLSRSSLRPGASDNGPCDPVGDNYNDEDEYAYLFFSPGR